MKDHSFYQYVMTVRGQNDEKGILAEEIFNDLAFPKQEKDFNALSDYIETAGNYSVSLSVFDSMYEDYQEWLQF
ncbi:YozE family protein [Staphylococcus sp. SQ8-PEA]|uniref:UPF0346 protein N9R04_02140 n=1 Tax=Staphylococcus marylandisciuri TaxID=2981529 RepID=A0ABT2QNG8_9STAP|nr:YozE family protein [Staphylococcus marylandisciuri]MCU5745522.1 YozE family protein [Staphylococcus marylandisciuri]